jgi:hypothetical protein
LTVAVAVAPQPQYLSRKISQISKSKRFRPLTKPTNPAILKPPPGEATKRPSPTGRSFFNNQIAKTEVRTYLPSIEYFAQNKGGGGCTILSNHERAETHPPNLPRSQRSSRHHHSAKTGQSASGSEASLPRERNRHPRRRLAPLDRRARRMEERRDLPPRGHLSRRQRNRPRQRPTAPRQPAHRRLGEPRPRRRHPRHPAQHRRAALLGQVHHPPLHPPTSTATPPTTPSPS